MSSQNAAVAIEWDGGGGGQAAGQPGSQCQVESGDAGMARDK